MVPQVGVGTDSTRLIGGPLVRFGRIGLQIGTFLAFTAYSVIHGCDREHDVSDLLVRDMESTELVEIMRVLAPRVRPALRGALATTRDSSTKSMMQ